MSSPTAEPGHFRGMTRVALDAGDIQRRRALVARWRRRSHLVRAMRKVLPAACVLILIGLAGAAIYNTLVGRLNVAKPANLTIRMLHPHFQGRNQSGRPFVLSADSAVRDEADPSRVVLDHPVFIQGSTAADQVRVRSIHGVYREDTRMLDLTGDVHLDNGDGYHFVTEHALVDTQKNNVDGEKHVDGHGPLGSISADSYVVRDGGAHAYFNGNVKTRIDQHGVAMAGGAPPAAPPAAEAPKP